MRDVLGVFSLPRAILFPGATLPLHVFEPRYRALVRDAMELDRVLAMALLRPGYEPDYNGNPEIYPIGCAGRITEAVPLQDGRFLISLTGLQRIEFLEMTCSAPYRSHRVRYLGELAPHPEAPAALHAMIRLVSARQQILASMDGAAGMAPIPTDLPFAETVNRIALELDLEPAVKYRLLENGDLLARAERLAAMLESALADYLDLPDGSVN